jgi:hypothetical protein
MDCENVALKAKVASLKLQNESLEIRLGAAHDKIKSLQQFCEGETVMRRATAEALEAATTSLNAALKAQESTRGLLQHFQGEAEKFREELMRRGADDPRKPKPECDTAFSALQVVCNRWDRDDCVADLKKQRAEHLRRIGALRSGRELTMDDVVKAMNEDDSNLRMVEDFQASLHHVLSEMREQLCVIYETLDPESAHEEWFKYPLSMFTSIADSENSDMEDDESMESE